MKHFEPFPLGHFKVNWTELGRRLKTLRLESNLSQRMLADLTGISAPTICRCENGEQIELDHFFMILQILGLPFQLPKRGTKGPVKLRFKI